MMAMWEPRKSVSEGKRMREVFFCSILCVVSSFRDR